VRKRDKAYKELGLTGTESDDVLIPLMAEHPTLLERPIGVLGDRAAVGRPPSNLLELL
jgi:arsenate reductase